MQQLHFPAYSLSSKLKSGPQTVATEARVSVGNSQLSLTLIRLRLQDGKFNPAIAAWSWVTSDHS